MKKAELRKIYKEKRALLSEKEREEMSAALARQFNQHFDASGKNIHVFLPILRLSEPDVFVLVKEFWANNVNVYTAIVRPGNLKLTHVQITPDTVYTPDDWGIPVPSGEPLEPGFKFDMVLVPMLCCDKKGNRVGYGKGYYDHFLAQQPQAFKAGIGFFEPVDVKIKDLEKHDIPLDALITPGEVFAFKHKK